MIADNREQIARKGFVCVQRIDCLHRFQLYARPLHRIDRLPDGGFIAVVRGIDIRKADYRIENHGLRFLKPQCFFQPVITDNQALFFRRKIKTADAAGIIQFLRGKCGYRMGTSEKDCIHAVVVHLIERLIRDIQRPVVVIQEFRLEQFPGKDCRNDQRHKKRCRMF